MFLIFFGSRTGKTESLLLNAACPYCEQRNSLTFRSTPLYFHLFWIPLFKVSTHKEAICAHCKRGYDYAEFSPEMQQEAATRSARG
jgi:uncharacterized Zn-finger protein